MGVEELQAKIESYQRKVDEALDKGDDDAAERYGIEVQKLERKLVKEEAKLPVHPA
jgi:phage shock protein A